MARRRCSAQVLGGGKDSILANLNASASSAAVAVPRLSWLGGGGPWCCSRRLGDVARHLGRRDQGDHATSEQELRAARISSVIVGAIAITIGILAKGQNVAHLVALAFAVAASANLPVILLTFYWKRCNTAGVVRPASSSARSRRSPWCSSART